MEPLSLVPLGSEGCNFVQRSLTYGYSLSTRLLRTLDCRPSDCFAILPAADANRRIDNLDSGGLQSQRDDVDSYLAAVIERQAGRVGYFIAETFYDCSEPWPDRQYSLRFCSDGHVVVYCRLESGATAVADVLVGATAYPLCTFVVGGPGGPDLPRDGEVVPPAVVDALVSRVKMVAIAAFDEESFVVWLPEHRRRGSASGAGH
jgi:hypothetical protein